MLIFFYIYIFIIGILFGSFTNVLIYRIPIKLSIVFPFSHCPVCKHKIQWYDNIPILSYVLLGGKCRYCKSKISIQYPIIETISGLIFVLIYYKFGLSLNAIIYMLLTPLLISIFIIDMKTQYIYDSENIAVFILFLVYFFYQLIIVHKFLWENLISGGISLMVFAGIFFLAKLFYKKEEFGSGDIFLGTVLAFFFTYRYFMIFFVLSTTLAALYGLIILLFFKKHHVAFGPFLIVSLYIVLFFSHFFQLVLKPYITI